MRYLEVRRHSIRIKPSEHLSQEGVRLARSVGETLVPFDRVLTSTLPRAYETAIAMGFAVDEYLEDLGTDHLEKVGPEIDWNAGFAGWAQAARRGGATTEFVRAQAKLWHSIVETLPDGGQALIIGHEGIMEGGAVGCLPNANHAAWGPMCGYCEGVRLAFDGERFTNAEILRVERIE